MTIDNRGRPLTPTTMFRQHQVFDTIRSHQETLFDDRLHFCMQTVILALNFLLGIPERMFNEINHTYEGDRYPKAAHECCQDD